MQEAEQVDKRKEGMTMKYVYYSSIGNIDHTQKHITLVKWRVADNKYLIRPVCNNSKVIRNRMNLKCKVTCIKCQAWRDKQISKEVTP
jgi:hypothetical protein